MVEIREIRTIFVEIVSLGTEVVIDDIETYRELLCVRGVDQLLKITRSSVAVLHRERENPVVAPVPPTGKLRNRHQFNRRYSKIFDPIEMRNESSKRAFLRERSDVQFVENGFAERDAFPRLICPLKCGRVNDLRSRVHATGLESRCRVRSGVARIEPVGVPRAWLDVIYDGAKISK